MYRPTFLSFFGAVITMMLFSFTAFAASLSDIRVSSALNQNLLAEVTVLGVGDRDQLAVSLAPDSIWLKTGISPLPELAGLRFSVKEGRGGQVITIIGKRPLREPVVEFILQVKTAQGTLQRWYTLLLDPPEEVQAAATVAQVAPAEVEVVQPPAPVALAELAAPPVSEPPVVQPRVTAAPKPKPRPVVPPPARVTALPANDEPEAAGRTSGFNRLPGLQRMESESVVDAAPVREKAPAADTLRQPSRSKAAEKKAPKPDEKSALSEPLAKNSYGPVRAGETLYSIANELRPVGVTLSQTMAAILRTNPEAFSGKSENLSVGSQLYIPPKVVMTVLSDSEAKAFLRPGRVTRQNDRKPRAAAASRGSARQPERRRTVAKPQRSQQMAKPEPSQASARMVETVDETLPIARTFPLEGAIEQPSVSSAAPRDVPNVPSKARAPRNLNPGVSGFRNNSDPDDIPLATTYPPDYVAPAPDSGESVAAPTANTTTKDMQQRPIDPEAGNAETASGAEEAAVPSPAASDPDSMDIDQQRAAIQQRAEEARKLAESARAEIERVKQRQAEIEEERADQLEAAALELEQAKADRRALEALVAKPGSEKTAQATELDATKVVDPAAEPAVSAGEEGTDLLVAELTSLPADRSAVMAVSQQPGSAAVKTVTDEDVNTKDAESEAAEDDGGEAPNPATDPEADDEESDAAAQVSAAPSQPGSTDAANPVPTNSPATVAEIEQSPTNESGADWLAKAKSSGQQVVAVVGSTASAAASAMNDEPAELAPTDMNNFADPDFWANYFNRLKEGNIQAHNPILWAVLLGLLLLWLLSRVTGRKEKFSEPKDYGDLDGESGDEKTAAEASRTAAALGAGAAAVAVSKDPIGDANFHIDYGMHAQALDIVRAAKPVAKDELLQQLLLKEADILVAQGDTDALHMLSRNQSDNAELQAHIATLENAAKSKAAEATESEIESAADNEVDTADKPPPEEVEPLVDDLDSLIADDDLLLAAAASETDNVQTEVAEPTATNNLVDFDLDDLDVPDTATTADATDAGSTAGLADDNSLDFDLDSLNAELDGLTEDASSSAASDGGDVESDEGLLSQKDDGKGDGVDELEQLEELTASLGGDSDIDDLDASFANDDGLDELAASLASEEGSSDGSDDSSLDDEFLVEAISEPAKPAPAAAADPAAEISFGDVLSTQLDLARAYSDMGDTDEARKLLETVIERGSERQIAEASQLLKELG